MLDQIKDTIYSKAANLIEKISIEHDVIHINAPAENILSLISLIKNDSELSFKQLVDITCVDYPSRVKRFEVVYQMLSLKNNIRLTIKTGLENNEYTYSLTPIFESANWLEREVFDMYGVRFKSHPDLRRILTDYGFEGYPQRKDFPLTGYVEVRYDGEKGRVVYEPVKLYQDYRSFDYLSPWEGTEYVLPGDEKAKS